MVSGTLTYDTPLFVMEIHLKAFMLLCADGIACLHVAVLPQLYELCERAGVHVVRSLVPAAFRLAEPWHHRLGGVTAIVSQFACLHAAGIPCPHAAVIPRL